jgi:DNA primase
MSPEDDARLRMRKRLLELHKEAAEWFHKNLLRTPAAAKARDYLKKRGLTSQVAVNWTLGYAPNSWDAFSHFAESRGFRPEEIAKSGLVSTREESGDYYDRFRDRLMFPIRNDYGEVIAFSGRVLDSSDTAKYINSPETMLFTKGNVLFGLHASKRDLINAKTAIVCEGQIDLISAFEAGARNVVAPQGTAFTERQASMLKRFVEGVVLCFDSDAAGEKAAERSLAALLDQGLLVRVATMPTGEDPDSLIRTQGADAFREIIEKAPTFFDFQISKLQGNADVAARQQFARKMAEFIALVRDPVIREDAISKTVSRIGILRADFEKSIPRVRSTSSTPEEKPTEEGLQFEPPSHAMRMLCLFVLRSFRLRERIRSQPWLTIVEGQTGADFLEKILLSPVDAEKPASVSSFLASLDSSEEAYAAALLNERLPKEIDEPALQFWTDFCATQINRQLKRVQQSLIAALATGQDISDWQKQQKEILDLKNVLTDIPQPSRPNEDPF